MTLESMIADIVGRRSRGFSDVARKVAVVGEALLEARGVTGPHKPRGIDLTLRRGEVVGVAGLLGSGRSSLARVLTGIEPMTAGEIRIRGRAVAIASPRDAIASGIALVPEDRARQGFVAQHSIESNVALPISTACRACPSFRVAARAASSTRRSTGCASRRRAATMPCATCPAATRRRW
jgi:ribose transport system ATP-binding protein